MTEQVNHAPADMRIAQKDSNPDADTTLARHEAAIQDLFMKIEVFARTADSLEAARKKIEKHMSMLTRTEKKVYPLLARGKTDKEIAAELGIATRTVSMHVGNIKTKLRIGDRSDFIVPSPIL